MGHTWGVNERMPSLTCIPPYVIIFSVIEGILHGKYYFRDDIVSKIIEELSEEQILVRFDQSQIRGKFQGF